jgi:hypothetical protein
MIYQTIDNASQFRDVFQFRDAFHHANRANQFSYEALGLIFDYLNDCGSDVELDVIGVCCEFAEGHYSELAEEYSIDIEDMDESEIRSTVIEYLQDNTSYVGETSTGSLVFVQF